MLARLRSWWAGRSMMERVLVTVGIPVAAVAALVGARQDRARREAAPDDSEGGPGTEALPTTAPAVLNVGAPGVGVDQIASLTEVFAGEISELEKTTAGLETQFGNTATQRARQSAALDARLDKIEAALRKQVAAAAKKKNPGLVEGLLNDPAAGGGDTVTTGPFTPIPFGQ